MSELSVYEVLAKAFLQEQVRTCFALLGDANMNWASAMATGGCDFVYVRHEHCAVAAAMAYARTSGEVGVATVTCGPGLTQIMTALPAAVRAHISMVIFAGEAPVKSNWYNQAIDQKPFVDACGATYVRLQHQQSMRSRIRDAFLMATTEKRPVVIGVPMDLQQDAWQQSLEALPPSQAIKTAAAQALPDKESYLRAVEKIERAKKIVVMAGLGAISADAGPACQLLAEQVGGLLATTLPAKGLFYKDTYSLGVAGGFSSDVARKYLTDADLIIAVGVSLASHNSDSGKLFTADKVLQIDVSPTSVNQGRESAQHHLCCDARVGVQALSEMLTARNANDDNYWRSAAVATAIRDTPTDSQKYPIEPGLLDPRDVVSLLDELIPENWYTVNSSGHCSCFFAQMKNRPANRFFTLREFGAIGNGLSFAMGVATANPQEPVVLFDGDGSLLMHIQEFETVLRHHMNILVVVINDGAYGSEVHKLRAEGLPEQGSVFGRPDFASISKGFGGVGATVTHLDDLPPLIAQFSELSRSPLVDAATNRLLVIDVHVSDKVVSSVIRRSHQH